MNDSRSLPGRPTSLWIDTTPDTNLPTLQTDGVAVDVAVIGGGIAGLTAATLLKAAGRTVAVIEARRILQGVTGYTTAKVTSQHGLLYDHLLRHFGEEKARAYAGANQAAIEQIAALVRERNIACDFERTEAYVYTESAEEVSALEAEVKAASRLGLPAALTAETPLPFPVQAALRFDSQARFHPRRYLLALASGIPGDGSHVFEQTRVLDIEEGETSRVITALGTVLARDVIIATHFPAWDRAFFFARMTPHRSYVLALRLEEAIPPRGMYISTEPVYSLRGHPVGAGEELLLVGGEGHKAGQGDDTVARYRRLEAWARERFPVRSVEYRWSTQDNRTFDRVPYIGPASPTSRHLWVATGFGGWGMTNGTVAGMLLRDRILGRGSPWAEVYDPSRFHIDAAPDFVRENLNVAAHLLGDRLGRAEPDYPAPGTGAIVETERGKVAVYREEDGTAVHALSPACTHMGCIVGWNPAERSWDCPCHGSRFAFDGTAIHGPAIRDLERVEQP